MLPKQKVKWLIANDPSSRSAQIFAELTQALKNESEFLLEHLYTLSYEEFHLAVTVIKEWRLDRYYLGKTASSIQFHGPSTEFADKLVDKAGKT